MKIKSIKLLLLSVVFYLPMCVQPIDSQNPFDAASTDFQRWGPTLPDDAIMPNPELIQRMERWSLVAFSGKNTLDDAVTFSLQLIRQDHNTLKFDFQYGGVNSSELLPYWTFETKDIDRCIFPKHILKI